MPRIPRNETAFRSIYQVDRKLAFVHKRGSIRSEGQLNAGKYVRRDGCGTMSGACMVVEISGATYPTLHAAQRRRMDRGE
jgi:hypothetical protein